MLHICIEELFWTRVISTQEHCEMAAQLTQPWRELMPLHVSLIQTTINNGNENK